MSAEGVIGSVCPSRSAARLGRAHRSVAVRASTTTGAGGPVRTATELLASMDLASGVSGDIQATVLTKSTPHGIAALRRGPEVETTVERTPSGTSSARVHLALAGFGRPEPALAKIITQVGPTRAPFDQGAGAAAKARAASASGSFEARRTVMSVHICAWRRPRKAA